jgi:hypothetical protein
LGEFSPIGYVFFGQFFFKLRIGPDFLGYFFQWQKFCIDFDKKWDRMNFGRFFRKLIWSPWRQTANDVK